ncbi:MULTISPECIES: hypothetical protein [unclassified Lysobacter]|uniref:hypothetical protein n=1 Tax=unclassified Lysobacter TaxID=2635362 RepID=UPI001BEC7919|nr:MULTISPECIES: hypothetical protein [unclassified Lysobacter]MBT2746594.1 hypothetical protein [Lysobacter sp. ISL-42]MBT2753411.1 hypothetical protein [Lysobacter sp. ISL-50]MBT2775521.1 hypothetical protein [Lysobacter sp. ISL-54]MBT2782943.1 hypothetical protein [Lysobacter sp. ISL-52]
MKSNPMRIVLATGVMAWAGITHAAPPDFLAKWQIDSVIVGVHSSIPPTCVQPTANAVSTWNAVGANFLLFPDFIVSQPRVAEQTQAYDYKNVTIEDGTPQNPLAIMVARVRMNVTTKVLENADITVDKRRIGNNDPTQIQLSCSTADTVPPAQVDWESAILHELGHVVGINDSQSDIGCSMYFELGPGQKQRSLCADEKQVYIDGYKPFKIVSLANVTGPQNVSIPAQIFYEGIPRFPVQRKTKIIECASGWTCSDYNGAYSTYAASPLTFNFKCTNSSPLPTATFKWRTTLTDANGKVTNAVDHTSTCTRPAGTKAEGSDAVSGGINRVIITD